MTEPEAIMDTSDVLINTNGSIMYASIVTIILAALILLIIIHSLKYNSHSSNSITETACNSCKKIQNKDLFYLCVILGICLVVVFSFVFYSNQDAINLFSFASTLSSIILSVVAIFMSINGEKTQELHRNQIEHTANKLESTRVKLEENIETLNTKLDKLERKLQTVVDNTDTLVTRWKKIQSDDNKKIATSYKDNDFDD